jgi:asparagine synthase (glutamine-hydrolysing)
MCGFAGFYSPGALAANAKSLVVQMADRLWQRGPDGAGDWVRRLAIVDLSELGHQPMASADGRFVLAMNGEIYNHLKIRAELESHGQALKGASDTEVLLESISQWGLESTLQRAIGMFAFALVDLQERKLFLVRDRLGEKPLYYGWSKSHFFFGSELKAFRPHPDFVPEVNRGAVALFLRHGYLPSPHCIFTGFQKLLPGHILTLSLDGSARPGAERLKKYWAVPRPGEPLGFSGSPEDCVAGLEELLGDAIRMQMLADVPVGAFLSGGIDSSTVVSLMQQMASRPIKTFNLGFPDARFDESGHASRIAAHLGTDHTTWQCTDSELLELVNQLPNAYSEPFADDSQLPTLALARMARKQVTVSLSGDGGDELFLGYGRYLKTLRRWGELKSHPHLGTGLRCGLDSISSLLTLLPASKTKKRYLAKLNRARNQWLPKDLPAYYGHRTALNKNAERYLFHSEALRDFFEMHGPIPEDTNDLSWLSYLDLNTYLPDDLLAKVDRAGMAFSLETRMPLLDHRIVEFAARLPDNLKRRNEQSKWPLRQILERRVPVALTERTKVGLSTPMGRWLRGPLRDWAEAQLSETRLKQEGFFDVSELRQLWTQHQSGKRDRGLMLWGFLMYQAWYETF